MPDPDWITPPTAAGCRVHLDACLSQATLIGFSAGGMLCIAACRRAELNLKMGEALIGATHGVHHKPDQYEQTNLTSGVAWHINLLVQRTCPHACLRWHRYPRS